VGNLSIEWNVTTTLNGIVNLQSRVVKVGHNTTVCVLLGYKEGTVWGYREGTVCCSEGYREGTVWGI